MESLGIPRAIQRNSWINIVECRSSGLICIGIRKNYLADWRLRMLGPWEFQERLWKRPSGRRQDVLGIQSLKETRASCADWSVKIAKMTRSQRWIRSLLSLNIVGRKKRERERQIFSHLLSCARNKTREINEIEGKTGSIVIAFDRD